MSSPASEKPARNKWRQRGSDQELQAKPVGY